MPIPPPKRGHNIEFAMTRGEIDAVIKFTPSRKTKAVLILESYGFAVREIVMFNFGVFHGDKRLEGIRQDYFEILTEFSDGFEMSDVAVWRRTKKALMKAKDAKIVRFDEDKIPFPEALRILKEETPLRGDLEAMAKRVHFLNGGPRDIRDPLLDCPHLDCRAFRDILEDYNRERKNPPS